MNSPPIHSCNNKHLTYACVILVTLTSTADPFMWCSPENTLPPEIFLGGSLMKGSAICVCVCVFVYVYYIYTHILVD